MWALKLTRCSEDMCANIALSAQRHQADFELRLTENQSKDARRAGLSLHLRFRTDSVFS